MAGSITSRFRHGIGRYRHRIGCLVLCQRRQPLVVFRQSATIFFLNRIAQLIAGDGAADINYHGMKPNGIDFLVRKAVKGIYDVKKNIVDNE